MDGLHAQRVLRGDRRQHAHAEYAAHLEGFQIGLNACAAAAVGAGDGEGLCNLRHLFSPD